MLSLQTALQFVAVAALLGLAPGPDNLFVILQSALRGARSGIAVTLGLCSGLLVHTGAVALGVASLLAASATAFTALKLIGAAYLLYLAYGALRAGRAASEQQPVETRSMGALYGRGILMNVSNPKVAIFFLALLPQFVQPDAGPVALQIFQLGGLFILTSLTIFAGLAVAAGRLSAWLQRRPGSLTLLNRLAGLVFVGLAARLLTAQR